MPLPLKILKIIILTATFNRAGKLHSFLRSLDAAFQQLPTSCIVELFVVNNNSVDFTSQLLSRPRPYKTTEYLTPSDFYWAESMSFGYKCIIEQRIVFDYLLAWRFYSLI